MKDHMAIYKGVLCSDRKTQEVQETAEIRHFFLAVSCGLELLLGNTGQ